LRLRPTRKPTPPEECDRRAAPVRLPVGWSSSWLCSRSREVHPVIGKYRNDNEKHLARAGDRHEPRRSLCRVLRLASFRPPCKLFAPPLRMCFRANLYGRKPIQKPRLQASVSRLVPHRSCQAHDYGPAEKDRGACSAGGWSHCRLARRRSRLVRQIVVRDGNARGFRLSLS
jgi:hypothetical protein